MFRYRLRTLLILMAVGPPMLAWAWLNYPRPIYAPESEKVLKELEAINKALANMSPGPIYCGPYDEQGNPCPVSRSEPATPFDPMTDRFKIGRYPPHVPFHDPRLAVVDGCGGDFIVLIAVGQTGFAGTIEGNAFTVIAAVIVIGDFTRTHRRAQARQ